MDDTRFEEALKILDDGSRDDDRPSPYFRLLRAGFDLVDAREKPAAPAGDTPRPAAPECSGTFNHLLMSIRYCLPVTPPGSIVRDILTLVQEELWHHNARLLGKPPGDDPKPNRARARRIARALGHRIGRWKPHPHNMFVAVCRDCKFPVFVYASGIAPLSPCWIRKKGRPRLPSYRVGGGR